MSSSFAKKYRLIWIYGGSLALLLFVLKWLELRFIIYDHALDIYIGAIALLFTLLGIWLALKLSKPKTKTVIVEKTVYQPAAVDFSLNQAALREMGLSTRELEVLQLLAKGHSNKNIAEQLYVSLNTVKTHCSKIFEKMEVHSRMQAIEKAKGIGLLP
jgi:two-component system, NarL family, response regulator LiaR